MTRRDRGRHHLLQDSQDGDLDLESRCPVFGIHNRSPALISTVAPSGKAVKRRDIAQIAASTIAAQGGLHLGLSKLVLLTSERGSRVVVSS